MKKPLLYIIRKNSEKRINRLEYSINHPLEKQEKVLNYLVKTAKNTEWGKLHNFSGIYNNDDFCKNIEIQDYNSLKPYIERLMRGEKNLLWAGKINWFAKSSGTTASRSKFIPVTTESLYDCHYKAGKDLLAIIYRNFSSIKIHNGYGVTLAGCLKNNEMTNNSVTGDLSAILMKNLPFWTHIWQQPDIKTSLMPDWEFKLEKIAQTTKGKNITHITGIPTWTVLLLNKILGITGKSKLEEVWPGIELYIHGGVCFDPYKELFRKLITVENMHYIENYNASEGYFGFQDQVDSDSLLLLVDHGVYFEFIPVNELEKGNLVAVSLGDVEINKNYAMVISTNAGLWRYMIGDTVRFTSVNPYRYKLSGRSKNFINTFGEELIVENTEKAISEACKNTNAIINDYTVGPVFFNDKKNGCHEWIIEFSKQPDNLALFVNILDKTLQSLNSDYEAKRYKNIALTQPLITIVPEKTFYLWLKIKGKIGGQNKVPRLYNTRQYVEEIKDFVICNM